MMGLFSTLDAMLDQNMKEALSDITLPSSIEEVLCHNQGHLKHIYDLMIAYEKANWDEAISLCNQMNIDEGNLYTAYLDSVKWAAEIVHMMYQKL